MNALSTLLIALAPVALKWNLFLTAAALVTFALSKLSVAKVTSGSKQLLLRGLLVAALLPPIVSTLASHIFSPANIFAPAVQIAEMSPSFAPIVPRDVAFIMSQAPNKEQILQDTFKIVGLAAGFLLLIFIFGTIRLVRIFRDHQKLRNLVTRSFTLRKIGRVQILVSDAVSVPFASSLGFKSLVVIPQTLLTQPQSLKLAIRHELQHHRQKDLQWNTLLEAARVIAGWNPLVLWWLERIEETDELACDENLLGRGRINVIDYATCLYEVALIAQSTGGCARLVGTASMATSPQFLKRRIAMTLQPPMTSSRKVIALAIGLSLALSAGAAWASESLIKDRRISQTQAESLARKVQSTNGIPIVVNKRVLSFLNLATGSPRTRFYMRNVLKRMKTFQPMISAKLKAAGLTEDLLAVPAVESGYQNTETTTSAGVWQFIPETARKFGLQVDDSRDERLNAQKETDAALTYLSKNYVMFNNDWHLALLSYNQGESSVRDIVAKSGIRDVFQLADAGLLKSDECANYVPKLIAALIIIANPSLVEE